jgi:hypothetical protein
LNDELRTELLEMAAADQAFRNDPERFGRSAGADWDAEQARTARIAETMTAHGWPGHTLVGEEASSAAWLLVQHADRDVDFQERALALLSAAVERGDASPRDEAYLSRTRRAWAGAVCGTQFHAADGVAVPLPIEDPDGLDERRSRAGLETFAENLARIQSVIAERDF